MLVGAQSKISRLKKKQLRKTTREEKNYDVITAHLKQITCKSFFQQVMNSKPACVSATSLVQNRPLFYTKHTKQDPNTQNRIQPPSESLKTALSFQQQLAALPILTLKKQNPHSCPQRETDIVIITRSKRFLEVSQGIEETMAY